jgi:type IV secretion system protein VirB11
MENLDFDIFAGPKPVETAASERTVDDSHAIIDAKLTRLRGYYTHPDVEEICINQPGEIWLRRRRPKPGEDIWNQLADNSLTFEYFEQVCKMISNANGVRFGNGPGLTPAVYAALPGGHRFTAAMYGNIVYEQVTSQGGIAMAIRQAPRGDNTIEYSHYGLEDGVNVTAPPKFKEMASDAKDSLSKLKAAINGGSHLIVSGATSTGKTTLLNRIIQELDPKLRIATVEDTRELVVPNKNRFHIVLSRTEQANNFNDAKAIDLLTRMTPDVILCGEISTSNAGTIWELTGSGHGSMMTTIHAEDPEQALKAFVERIRHTQPAIDDSRTIEEMRKRFTVVQINRSHNGARRITAIETFN